MSAPWFYMPQLPPVGWPAALEAREARHAMSARRLARGEAICVFDGAGNVGEGEISAVSGRDVQLICHAITTHDHPRQRVRVASALPKGDRQGVMLSMATQLGMTTFTPLHCQRSVARPGRSFQDRTQRICIEACKQSRRPYLPAVEQEKNVMDAAGSAIEEGSAVFIAHPGSPRESVGLLSGCENISLLVGPEGGFSDDELQRAIEIGAQPVSLGEAILRVETAVVALVSLSVFGPNCANAASHY